MRSKEQCSWVVEVCGLHEMVKLQAGAPGSLVVVAFVRTVCLGEVVVLVGILGTLSVLCWRCCAWQVTSFETIQVHQEFHGAGIFSRISATSHTYGLADRYPSALPLDGGSEDNGWDGPLSRLQGAVFRKGVPVQSPGRVSQNRVQEQCSGTPFGSSLLGESSLSVSRYTVPEQRSWCPFCRWLLSMRALGALCGGAFVGLLLCLVRWSGLGGIPGVPGGLGCRALCLSALKVKVTRFEPI